MKGIPIIISTRAIFKMARPMERASTPGLMGKFMMDSGKMA